MLPPHETMDGKGNCDAESEPKFSTFVRSLEVKLDPAMYPDATTAPRDVCNGQEVVGAGADADEASGGSVIRWEADSVPAGASAMDGFEIKRQGDRDCRVKIKLRVDHRPERYQLSAGLSALLGLDLETRPR
jgi:SWI/SNF-related matrix-associated actin-dependent regulator of chromatin subfamily D